MRVLSVMYERLTKHRVPNERAAVTVEVKSGECSAAAMRLAKQKVNEALGLMPSDADIDNAMETLEAAGYDVRS